MVNTRSKLKIAIAIILMSLDTAVWGVPPFTRQEIADNGGRGGGTSMVDVDGDGDLDFLYPRKNYCVYEYLGHSQWKYHDLGIPSNTDVGGCAFDVDKDGKIDAVTCGKWIRNGGGPAGANWERYDYSTVTGNHDVVGGDIDGDGWTDIVTMKGAQNLAWFRNPGVPAASHAWKQTVIATGLHGGAAPRGIGDLDGDGDNDIIRGDNWFENQDGQGKSWKDRPLNPGIPASRYPGGLCVRTWICDLNQDGHNDIVMTGCDIKDGPVLWYEGNGRGQFIRHIIAAGTGQCLHSLGVGDFDNDGDLDIVSGGSRDGADKNRKMYLWENHGKASGFTQHVIAVLGDDQTHELSIGDLEGDGDLDICTKGWTSSAIYCLINNLIPND